MIIGIISYINLVGSLAGPGLSNRFITGSTHQKASPPPPSLLGCKPMREYSEGGDASPPPSLICRRQMREGGDAPTEPYVHLSMHTALPPHGRVWLHPPPRRCFVRRAYSGTLDAVFFLTGPTGLRLHVAPRVTAPCRIFLVHGLPHFVEGWAFPFPTIGTPSPLGITTLRQSRIWFLQVFQWT
nr:hypothetical protein [Morchella crassipes]